MSRRELWAVTTLLGILGLLLVSALLLSALEAPDRRDRESLTPQY